MGILTIILAGRMPFQIMEDQVMPAFITEYPTVVKEILPVFADLFINEPERKHFAEYLTGLFLAERKNVSSINQLFAKTTDQSCMNRWLTEVTWDAEAINERRLDWLQQDPATRYCKNGVITLDNVLIDHDGKKIDDVGWFWDHAEQRYKIAHDYLIVSFVHPHGKSGKDAKHYPLEFRRFVKREQCEHDGKPFINHNAMFRDLVDWVIQHEIPGDFAFDSWFTNAENLNHIDECNRAYVGDLKFNRKIIFQGQEMKADQLTMRIKAKDRKKIIINDKTQWYFSKSIRINGVDHRVRIVILWDRRNSQSAQKILITNRTRWEANRILRVYGHRWVGTECFHRDGKQHLGMGDCQLRKGRGQTRHLYLVFLAYSVLMRQLRRRRSRNWARERLMTIGQGCQAITREVLSRMIRWVYERAVELGWNYRKIQEYLPII